MPISKLEKLAKKQKAAWFEATASGNIEVMKELLDSGFNIDTLDREENSALILASFFNKLNVIDFLIKNKCNLDLKCSQSISFLSGAKMSALSTAAALGHIDAMKILLGAGASMQCQEDNTQNVGIGGLYQAPLYQAVYGGHEEAVILLIKNGAKVDMTHIVNCTKITGAGFNSFQIEEIIGKAKIHLLKLDLDKGIEADNLSTHKPALKI